MPDVKNIIISTNINVRIDKYLSNILPNISRSRIQELIKDGSILVNNSYVKQNYIPKIGDTITVTVSSLTPAEIASENIPIEIIFEDEDLLVVNKPAGMRVHPAGGIVSGTLVNALLYHCKNLSSIGGDTKPGIVHRLDKDTSGLLVVAKNDSTHIALSEQFKSRKVKKIYNALVWGFFESDEGRIETYICRNPANRKKMMVIDKEMENRETRKHEREKMNHKSQTLNSKLKTHSRLAITKYKLLKQFGRIAYIEIGLETGRTHQIRVHLAYIGHPVVGDTVYGFIKKNWDGFSKNEMEVARRVQKILSRQALHSSVLGFEHPKTKEFMEFKSPLPEDIKNALSILEQSC